MSGEVIHYQVEPELAADEFIDVLHRSTLAERRPVGDTDTIVQMLKHADIIVTARDSAGLLVGVARAISDFSYCTYLSDLAVDTEFQRQAIGRELIERTRRAANKRRPSGGGEASLILLAAPKARAYYQHIGMQRHDSCWIQRDD